MLLKNSDVISFLIRRACRILPLAWLFILVVLAYHRAPGAAWAANIFFYADLPPFYLDFGTGHFWSLCIEVQFYCAIAVIVAVAGRRGLWAVPFILRPCYNTTNHRPRRRLDRDVV